MCNFKVLLSDIEGTTTSIAFVKEVLFPFAAEHVTDFLQKIVESKDTEDIALLDDLVQTSNHFASENVAMNKIDPEKDADPALLVSKLVQNIRTWIQQDKKHTCLKNLQGIMWREGYRDGRIKAHIYADIPMAFEEFKKDGIPIYIYSSGSVEAQQLLFSHTVAGNFSEFISGYFDTNIGPKMDCQSYKRIAEKISTNPADILFLTDVEKEALAADSIGIQVRLVLREGNAPLSEEALAKFKTICSFSELFQRGVTHIP